MAGAPPAEIRSVNLPNILMNDSIVPELLQEACTPENVAGEVAKFLDTENAAPRTQFQNKMEELRRLMGAGKINPSRRAAEIVLREINGANASSAALDASITPISAASDASTTPISAGSDTSAAPHKIPEPAARVAPERMSAPAPRTPEA